MAVCLDEMLERSVCVVRVVDCVYDCLRRRCGGLSSSSRTISSCHPCTACTALIDCFPVNPQPYARLAHDGTTSHTFLADACLHELIVSDCIALG